MMSCHHRKIRIFRTFFQDISGFQDNSGFCQVFFRCFLGIFPVLSGFFFRCLLGIFEVLFRYFQEFFRCFQVFFRCFSGVIQAFFRDFLRFFFQVVLQVSFSGFFQEYFRYFFRNFFSIRIKKHARRRRGVVQEQARRSSQFGDFKETTWLSKRPTFLGFLGIFLRCRMLHNEYCSQWCFP